MVWMNNSQDCTGNPCDARTGIVRAPHGNLQCFSYPTAQSLDSIPFLSFCVCLHPLSHSTIEKLLYSIYMGGGAAEKTEGGWYQATVSYGTCAGSVRDPQGCRSAPLRTRKGIDTTRIGKNLALASYFAVRARYDPRTGCLQYLNPYGVRKLIMHALKLYGPRTGGQNSYVAARGTPWMDVRFSFKTAREQPVRGPGVWCDWGIMPH